MFEVNDLGYERLCQSRKAAIEFVAEKQPLGALPDWFLHSIVTSRREHSDGNWVVTIDAFTKRNLSDGERWIQLHGHRTVARLNPETGEEVVELYGNSNQGRITLFEIKVDLLNQQCVMLQEPNLTQIDKSKIEITEGRLPDSLLPYA